MHRLKIASLLAALVVAGVVAAGRSRLALRRSSPTTALAEGRGVRAGTGRTKRRVWQIAVLFAGLGVGGFLVAASGIVPIKASSGHWAITAWFLHFAMQRSVATHTLGLTAPVLDEPRLMLQGAGHYETGCRPCHGSPERQPPRIPQHMTPHPPYLPPRIATWTSAELFYIVKHGVKFTGMPAWPTQQRDDEVWAMVAFLRALPRLDAAAYRRLVHGETASGDTGTLHGLLGAEKVPEAITESCARCHGLDGRGRGTGAFPKLAGQNPTYLYAALQAYAQGKRHSGIMEPVAAGLSREAMRELARYYADTSEPALPPQETTLAIERGKEIANRGIPSQRVPSCVHCHGPGTARRNPIYPLLAGQYADYLVQQLELFKQGQRGGSSYAHLMRPVVARLTPEHMRDVALYYASLPAVPPSPDALQGPGSSQSRTSLFAAED